MIKRSDYKSELTDYIKFPFSLYKTMSSGPVIADELESFDKRKIRFKSAEAYFILPIEIMKLLDEFQQLSIGAVNDQQKKESPFWLV
jgi:hypothetical protein